MMACGVFAGKFSHVKAPVDERSEELEGGGCKKRGPRAGGKDLFPGWDLYLQRQSSPTRR